VSFTTTLKIQFDPRDGPPITWAVLEARGMCARGGPTEVGLRAAKMTRLAYYYVILLQLLLEINASHDNSHWTWSVHTNAHTNFCSNMAGKLFSPISTPPVLSVYALFTGSFAQEGTWARLMARCGNSWNAASCTQGPPTSGAICQKSSSCTCSNPPPGIGAWAGTGGDDVVLCGSG
jgi:hypothetical protein